MNHSAVAEQASFDEIVDLYRPALVRYASRILGDSSRAEDAVQQTFLDAYVALAGGTEVLAMKPWLYRIAHNRSLNLLRDRVAVDLPDEYGTGGSSAAQVAESRARIREVLRAVSELPPRQRDAIVLRELEGRSYDEIASALGVGDGAVRQLLNRARHAVRAGVAAISPPSALRILELLSTSSPAAKATAGAIAAGAFSFTMPAPRPADPAPPKPRVSSHCRSCPKGHEPPPPAPRARPARRPAGQRPRPPVAKATAPPPRRRPVRAAKPRRKPEQRRPPAVGKSGHAVRPPRKT